MAARPKNYDWLKLTVEQPLEPDLPICDPHHHLWDNSPRIMERCLWGRRGEGEGGRREGSPDV